MTVIDGQQVVCMRAEDRDTLLMTVAKVLGQCRRMNKELERLKGRPTKRQVAEAERAAKR